jgi:hypothetical protein
VQFLHTSTDAARRAGVAGAEDAQRLLDRLDIYKNDLWVSRP